MTIDKSFEGLREEIRALKRENKTKTEIIQAVSPELQKYKKRDVQILRSLIAIRAAASDKETKESLSILIENIESKAMTELLRKR